MRVSLSRFMDFMLAATPAQRLAAVRDAMQDRSSAYDVRKDFYGPLRKAIIAVHRDGSSWKDVDNTVNDADHRRREHYDACLRGYRQWLGRTKVEWIGSKSVMWRSGELEVSVNPELAISMRNSTVVIKLYFKEAPIGKTRATTVLHLLSWAYGARFDSVAVLDVRRSRLITPSRRQADVSVPLAGEAAAFTAMWHELEAMMTESPIS